MNNPIEYKQIDVISKTNHIPNQIFHFSSINSTNSFLKRLILNNEKLAIISADYQEKGRGRYNRKWQSNPGKNLLFSIPIIFKKTTSHYQLFTIISGLALKNVITKYVNENITIKWPNDILIEDKKIAGILTEQIIFNDNRFIIIGMGINLLQKTFNESISNSTASLINFTNNDLQIDKFKILNQIITELDKLITVYLNGDISEILKNWEKSSNLIGKKMVLNDNYKNIYQVKAIDKKGYLKVVDNKGLIKLIINEEYKIIS